jgi:dCTP deaminase
VILSDRAIQEAIRASEIEITPVPIETRYTSSAVDLTLGSQFQGWNFSVLNVQGTRIELNLALQSYQKTAKAFLQSLRTEDDGSFVFPPYTKEPMVLLAQTQERIHLKRDSGLAARVEGRSSLARIGLTVHLTAPTIHCGFSGAITLELINYSPFYLRMVPGAVICQLILERVDGATGEIRTGFQNQLNPSGI